MNRKYAEVLTPSPFERKRQEAVSRKKTIAFVMMRVAVGAFLVPHGIDKTLHWERTVHFFTDIVHVHAIFAYLVTAMEIGGGLAIAMGLFVRPIAAVVVVFMVRAALFRSPHGYFWNAGGFEMPLFWGSLALALMVGGAGPFSLEWRTLWLLLAPPRLRKMAKRLTPPPRRTSPTQWGGS